MAVTMSPPSPAASDGSTNSADTAPPRTPPGQAQLPLPMPVDSTASNASNTGTANGNSSSGSTTPSATGANSANQGGVKRTTKASRRANTAERRATHNAVERARRETLNGRFLDLAALLPNLSQIRRPSKSAIVNSSIAHVSASRRHRILASQQLRTLKAECDALRSEANEWRVRAGIPRVEEPRRGEGFSVVLSGELEFEAGDLDLVAAEDMEDEDELSPGPGYDEQQQQQQQLIQLQQQQQQQLAAQQAQQAAAAQQVTITIPSAHPGGRQSHSPPHYASPPLSAGGMHSPSHYSGGTHSPPHYHPHPHHPYVTSPHADFVVPSSISAAAAAAAGGSPHADFVTPEYAAAVGSPMIASPVFEYDPSRVGPSGVGPYEFDYSGGAGAGASGGAGGQGQALHHQQIMIQQRAEQVQVDGGKWEGGMYGHGHGHGHGHGQVVGVW